MGFPANVNSITRLTSRPTLLDSGLRRAATGIPPSRRIQDFLSINDDGGGNDGEVESAP